MVKSGSRPPHMVRGVMTTIVLGVPMLYFGVVAAYALASQLIAGWLPSSWFSSNAADWMFAMGTEGGAADYFAFMLNGLLAAGCYSAIRWGFYGKS